jgi:hypothetical protein
MNPPTKIQEASTVLKRTTCKKNPTLPVLILILALIGPALLPTRTTAEPAIAESNTDLLQMLEQQGWQAQTGPDGSLIFRPPTTASEQKADVGGSKVPTTTGATPATASDVERLLLERGWRMETDASGNTLLLPAQAPRPSNRSLESVSPATTEEVAATTDPFVQFQRSLSEKGWLVKSASDGSILVYPPVRKEVSQAGKRDVGSTRRGYCAGIDLTAVQQQEVLLPIDSPEKAFRLATDWIANFGHADHAVGRIRRINQVYSVSVVDTEPPFHLRNQLIIRSDNGRVIAVY